MCQGFSIVCRVHFLAALVVASAAKAQPIESDVSAINQRLGRGINLGNALEAPHEGEWGVTLQESYLQEIADAGFDSVRIPVRWAAHAMEGPPYTIDPRFMERVQWAVDRALERGLMVVVNSHHYEAADSNPREELPRYQAIWRQVAEHFKGYPDALLFELHNEPHDQFDAQTWNELYPQLLAVVRESNPRRAVVIGPAHYNNRRGLADLKLPQDERVILTVHVYEPFRFTHQGAEWVGERSQEWLGQTWTGTPEQRRELAEGLDQIARFGREHNVPVYIGEFGVYSKAEMDSRVAWTRHLVQAMEQRGFTWAYWEFCSGFGAYDPEAEAWRKPLLEALMDDQESGAEDVNPLR